MTREDAAPAEKALDALRDAFQHFGRAMGKTLDDLAAQAHREAHPRITDNLHHLHRRYRKPK